jgi:hypothetical protein
VRVPPKTKGPPLWRLQVLWLLPSRYDRDWLRNDSIAGFRLSSGIELQTARKPSIASVVWISMQLPMHVDATIV